MAMRFPLVAMMAALLGLATARAREKPVESPAPRISLSPAAEGSWRVRYELREPITSLGFTRVPSAWRASRWTLHGEFRIVHDDAGARAERVDGAPFREIAFDIPARYLHLPGDYAPISPFSDGGLLIHTGEFHACPGAPVCPGTVEWPVTVSTPRGAHAVVLGGVHDAVVDFKRTGDGTNVSVGAAQPLEASHFMAFIRIALANAGLSMGD